MKWFLAGLGIGSAIGMLIAPKSGAETRDELLRSAQDQFNQARERIQPLVDEARQRLEPVVQQAREKAGPIINQARERLQPVVDDAREKLDSAVERVSDLKERVSPAGNGSSLLEIVNEWPHERLIEIDGIGPLLATKLIQNRPYESEQQLIEYKDLPPSAIENLRNAA